MYHNVKPASLQQQLEAVHLNPDKAEMLAQTWATSGPELVERLKHNVFAPKKVKLVNKFFGTNSEHHFNLNLTVFLTPSKINSHPDINYSLLFTLLYPFALSPV